jgi:hypothetical protein
MAKQIFVTNKNSFVHQDRYDGEDFVFPPGERVLISSDAATHLFAFNLPDKSEALVRLGWSMTYDPEKKTYVENLEGVKKLARFVFDEAVMVSKSSLLEKTHTSAAA